MNGKIKVYRFRQYDIAADEFKLSSRMATLACICRLDAQLIRSSELEIEKRLLNTDGMTDIIPADRLPGKSRLFNAAGWAEVGPRCNTGWAK